VKRGVFDTLKRGFDDNLANWPLIAIRIAQMVLVFAMVIGGMLAMLVPLLLSVGIRVASLHSPESFESAMEALLHNPLLFIWLGVGLFVLIGLLIAIGAFVEAGCARVYVDAERAAGPAVNGLRARFHLFNMQRFLAGATSGWWPVFWMYNLIWSLAALILLVPLAITAVLMFLTRNNQPLMIVFGVGGLLLVIVLAIPLAIVTGMWSNRAVMQWTIDRAGTGAAISASWRAISHDLPRHLGVAACMLVIAFAASSVAGSFGFFAAFAQAAGRDNAFVPLAMMPLRFFSQIVSIACSAAVTSWYAASFAALTVESPR